MEAIDKLIKLTEKEGIKCADIKATRGIYRQEIVTLELRLSYSKKDLVAFWEDMRYIDNFDFISGCIWLNNGSWVNPIKYANGRSWKRQSTPIVPDKLKQQAIWN